MYKAKYVIVYAVLAVAFAAVSLWVFLSGNKNAKAVRAKFRLGGLLLTVSSLLALSSCGRINIFEPTCYDVAAPEYVVFPSTQAIEVKVGDVINFKIQDITCDEYSYELKGQEDVLLQSGKLVLSEDTAKITIGKTDYRGYIILSVYGKDNDGETKFYLGERSFTLI